MAEIKAIVFDLDDTLYPECAFVLSAYAAVAEAFRDRLGDPQQTKADLTAIFDSPDRRRAFDALLAKRGMPADRDLIAAMIDTYRSHTPTISLHRDADAALSRLRNSYRLGLITDGPAVMQNAKVEALGIRSLVDHVILTDELGEGFGKPHPRAFEVMAEVLTVPHAQCAYVADNAKKDFIAPNALGWTTIQILRPDGIYSDAVPPAGGSPHHAIDTLDGIDAILP